MTSSHGNSHSEALEQIITEFYAKSLHIILEFRTPYMSSRNFSGEQALASPSSSSSSSSSMRPRDKWFNLALRECPAARENLDLCQCHFEPMVVDVIMVQRPLDCGQVKCSPKRDLARNLSLKERYPCCWNYEQDEFGCDAKSENIIERWVLQYESRKIRDINSRRRRSSNNNLSAVYKKSMLLLRSLHVTVRLTCVQSLSRHQFVWSNSAICYHLPGACCFQPTALPLYPPETSHVHKKDTSYDEYCPSPAISPSQSSASRSLPIFIPGSRPSKPHLQSESALASEPAAKLADFPAFSNKLNFTLRGTGSGSFKSDKTTGFNQHGTAVEKLFYFGKDEARQYSGGESIIQQLQ
ncbi:hypothetical protein EV2_019891 [Malus domestica]